MVTCLNTNKAITGWLYGENNKKALRYCITGYRENEIVLDGHKWRARLWSCGPLSGILSQALFTATGERTALLGTRLSFVKCDKLSGFFNHHVHDIYNFNLKIEWCQRIFVSSIDIFRP